MIGFRGRVFGGVVLFGGAFAALFAVDRFLLDAAVGQAGQEQDRAGCRVSVGSVGSGGAPAVAWALSWADWITLVSSRAVMDMVPPASYQRLMAATKD
ncbi:hypothetical protein Q3V23_36255 [Streptomyces sp. VNUA116]|uniref:hypothetical protein n=1 Tax=Streptomyces sp. VNUA116 TaxID=3062449 RepID=UPI0026758EB3|nr:hypothetical protein [Streptomyces sp. VNUA116]WKU42663.1 hypothetical protein Q3V23_00435 [Streptomyces sp. VNUA116]WKU49082.1 hypothetical protein Q3V23_36255 [Streptomyces sp. VNUA116]